MEKVKQLGNIFGYTGGNYSGNVYDSHALSLLRSIQCKEVTNSL